MCYLCYRQTVLQNSNSTAKLNEEQEKFISAIKKRVNKNVEVEKSDHQ